VHRVAAHPTPLYEVAGSFDGKLVAVITDVEHLTAPAPVLHFSDPNWLDALASQIERDIMRRAP
jgi:hypothetical protein